MSPVMSMAKELGLTKEQQDQIKAILSSNNDETKTLRTKMEASAKAQADLMSQDSPDEAAVLKGVDDIAKLRTDISKIRMHQVLGVQKILTPEQRTKVREIMKERLEKRGQGTNRKSDGEKRDHVIKPADAPAKVPAQALSPVPPPVPAS